MCNRLPQTCNTGGIGAQYAGGDFIQSGGGGRGNEQRRFHILRQRAHGSVLPLRDMRRNGQLEAGLARGLAQRERQSRAGVEHVLAEHQHRVGLFGLLDGGDLRGAALQDFDAECGHFRVARRLAVVEILRSDQHLQRVVGFQRRARRTDANRTALLHQAGDLGHRGFGIQHVLAMHGKARPVFTIDEAVAEAAAVADEIAVDFAVIAILDTLQAAVAFAGRDVATDGTVRADAGRGLQIPFACV